MCSSGKGRSALRLGPNPPLHRVRILTPRVVKDEVVGLPWRYGRTARRHPHPQHRPVRDMSSRGARLAALLTRIGPPPVHQVQLHDDAQLRTRLLLGLTDPRSTFSKDRSGASTDVDPRTHLVSTPKSRLFGRHFTPFQDGESVPSSRPPFRRTSFGHPLSTACGQPSTPPRHWPPRRIYAMNIILCVALSAFPQGGCVDEPSGNDLFPSRPRHTSAARAPTSTTARHWSPPTRRCGAPRAGNARSNDPCEAPGMGTARGPRPPRTVEGEGSPGKRI